MTDEEVFGFESPERSANSVYEITLMLFRSADSVMVNQYTFRNKSPRNVGDSIVLGASW